MSSTPSDKDDGSASVTSTSSHQDPDGKSDNSQDEHSVGELKEVTADTHTPEKVDIDTASQTQEHSDTEQSDPDPSNGNLINFNLFPLSNPDENQSPLSKEDESIHNEPKSPTATDKVGGENLSLENKGDSYPTSIASPESHYDEYSAFPSHEHGAAPVGGTHDIAAHDISSEPPPRHELMRHLTRAELMNQPGAPKDISPALARRLRDFRFAQKKRKERYGKQSPFGIIGLYDHLSGIRTDVEWAEDAAWRRENEEPYLSWADFEAAKDTGLNQPFFTYIVMFVCTVCLIVSIGVNDWKFAPLRENPMVGPSIETLVSLGAKQTSLIVDKKQWYRLFTPMVLHAGIIHYTLNMFALWFIGYAVEQSHGFFASAIIFILPAVGGTILSAIFLPEYISVGASGGIFGLIGACVADIVTNWNLLFSKVVNDDDTGVRFRHLKVLLWLLLDIILNILIGLTPLIDNFTHMGGMLYGFLCGISTMERLSKAFFGVRSNCRSRMQGACVRFTGIIVSVLLVIVTTIILFQSNENYLNCRGCRYVSCVPFPFWADKDQKWWYCDDCDTVTASLTMSTEAGFYSTMNLTCPNGEPELIDLSHKQIADEEWIKKQLATYCREYCDVLFRQ